MFQLLFVLFIIIPIIEITVIIQVGDLIGVWPTVAIVILSAWLGAKFVRQQGIATLQSVQAQMAQGEMPSDAIVTGLVLLIAGVLLVTPGFVTDAFGLLLLMPTVRTAIAKHLQKHITSGQFSAGASFGQGSPFEQGSKGNVYQHEGDTTPFSEPKANIPYHQGETLEGEFKRKD